VSITGVGGLLIRCFQSRPCAEYDKADPRASRSWSGLIIPPRTGDLAKGGRRRKGLKQIGVQPDRTRWNESFGLWTRYNAVVTLGMEWTRNPPDGGSDSGRTGGSDESFATYVSALLTIHTSPAPVARPTA